jgi:hypothetical protein
MSSATILQLSAVLLQQGVLTQRSGALQLTALRLTLAIECVKILLLALLSIV